jgi:hypothetical protein
MKKLAFCIFLSLLSDRSVSAGGISDGGGDHFYVAVRELDRVQRARVQEARDFIVKRLAGVELPPSLVVKTQEELAVILSENPQRMFVADVPFFGFRIPEKANGDTATDRYLEVVSTLTQLKSGGLVYFSKKLDDYSLEELGELLLHEVAHHIFGHPFNTNEELLDLFALLVMNHEKVTGTGLQAQHVRRLSS